VLLAAIRENPGVTRASLGRRTGLSRSAVASGVRALLADGLATEHGQGGKPAGDRGRPAALLSPAMPVSAVIGIDTAEHLSDAAGRAAG
jgi:winged helix-turn-helix DNA-binding protein